MKYTLHLTLASPLVPEDLYILIGRAPMSTGSLNLIKKEAPDVSYINTPRGTQAFENVRRFANHRLVPISVLRITHMPNMSTKTFLYINSIDSV